MTASATGTTETETAIFIGSTSKLTAAFIPMDITQDNDGSTAMTGTHYYKLSFKCKMLKNGNNGTNPGMPSIGITHTRVGYNEQTETDPAWAGNNYNSYTVNNGATLSDGVYSMRFKVVYGSTERRAKLGDGNRSFYITIGNAASRGTSQNSFVNYGASFIFSGISLYECDSDGSNVQEENLIPAINDENIDFKGTYFQRGDCATTKQWDGEEGAEAMKWHVLSQPNYVKAITVPSNYNTSSSYNAANFTKQGDTDYIREYYTNDNYSDLTFAKLADSNDAGFEVIPDDVNKKMIIIDANHEDEADSNTGTGVQYKPTKNKPANIFIPICFSQYNTNQYGYPTCTMTSNQPVGDSYLLKITMKAVRLEGEGHPVLGRIAGYKTGTSGKASQAMAYSCYNIDTGDYYANPVTGNETINDASGNRITYTYNAATGDFVGYIRVRANDNDYATRWGVSEIITIGNSEHAPSRGNFDSTAFNSSFAISDITMDVYAYSDKMGDLVASDIAPHFYADTVDTTTNRAFYPGSSVAYSNLDNDVIRAQQYLWSADGNAGMVHAENLSTCMANGHSLTHNAATDTTREYWGCSSCRKVYADPYGIEEITDTSATKQMATFDGVGSGAEVIFAPVKLSGYSGNQWYKFTCKVKCFGDDLPVLSTLQAKAAGGNSCQVTPADSDKDMTVWEYTYDTDTQILTGYIKAWMPTNYASGRLPYAYYNSVSGANAAILIGNGRYNGSNIGNGYTDQNHTTYAITEPTLYKINGATTAGSAGLTDAKSKSTTGDNLIAPITDKTVDFVTDYQPLASNSNNPLAAPIGKWYKTGSEKSSIKAREIPTGFYEGTATPNMVELRGLSSNTSSRYFFQKELFLDSEKTYTLEFDYRSFGGFDPYVSINYHTGSSWTTLTRTSESFTGSHATITFTTPAGLRESGGGNFLLRLGLPYEAKNTSSAYFTNVKVTSATTGNNAMLYGDFVFSDSTSAGTDTVSDTSTGAYLMPGWDNISNLVNGYSSVKVKSIPSGFFTGNDISGDTTVALQVQGQNYIEPQFKVRLKANTYYKFSYDYRSVDDAPEFFVRDDDVDKPTLISSYSGGKYRMTYQVYNSGDEDYSRFCFSYGANSSSKAMYIGNLQLYELTGAGGSTVGANIIGNMNAILDSSVYSGITSSGTAVTLTQDDATNITRDLANGWFVALPSNVYTNDAKVVKVASDFFNYKTPAQRQELIRKVVLGRASAVSGDPTYNPNNDSANGDIKDLVHSKLASLYHEGTVTNVSDPMVDKMFETIMNPNDSSGWVAGGTSYYVSSSEGNDSAAGTSSNTPLKTISKANSKASAGDTIYLKRGDTWRNTDLTVDASFTLKSGVHYAAYGSGAKPELLGSAKNYGGSSNSSGWTETSSGSHVWYYQYIASGSATTNANAGMIYFIDADGTVHPGKSIAAPNTNNNTYSYSEGDLDSDLEYFAPNKSGSNTITAGSYSTQGRIYVYSNTNPATRFPRIEIAPRHTVVEGNNGTSSSEAGVTTLNNIAVKYGGYHGIKSISGGSNFWINKCEIAYIGGGVQFTSDGSNRIGNGIEFGNGFTNGRVYDCYIHDCFDAGATFQSYGTGSEVSFNNIYFCRNVIENCTYNIEFFLNRNNSDSMSNIHIEDNILRNAGYGWGCYDRADGGFRIGNIAASKNSYINNVSSTYITNNIFDCTRMAHVMWTWSSSPDRHAGLTATGNTFIQRKGASDWSVMAYGPIGGGFQYASDKASLSTAAALFDTSPNAIIWLGDLG